MAEEPPQFGYPTPGVQRITPNEVMKNAFFMSDEEWKSIQDKGDFDYMVIGSSYCALGFIDRITTKYKDSCPRAGKFFSPRAFSKSSTSIHVQLAQFSGNISMENHKGHS